MKNSPYSENELLEIASKFKKHLKDHFSTIKSVCPDLDQEFIFRFKALYYEVHLHSLNLGSDNLHQVFKLELEEFANQVRNLAPIFRFYMNKAFPYDSKLWEEFGYCELEKVVLDYASLRKCLEGVVKLINEKRSELKAVNCPEPILEEIEYLSKKVSNTHDEILEHDDKQDVRNKILQIRMNELFKLMETVHDAASKCFQNEPDLLNHLTFPRKEASLQK